MSQIVASDCVVCKRPIPSGSKYCPACGSGVGLSSGAELAVPRDRIDELRERLDRAVAGRYTLGNLLGQGGMGAGFLAEDLALERRVAIKVLPTEFGRDEQIVARFQREAKTAAKLDHPHIIPIYRVESDGDLHFFVMKFVAGQSLEEILGYGMPPVDLARRVLVEAAEALGHAH